MSPLLFEDEDYWTKARLIDELFLQLAGTKTIVSHNGKEITIFKYYNRALLLIKPIVIAKSANHTAEFVVNLSDLTTKIVTELKAEDDSQNLLKLAVGRIFENINAWLFHMSIARNLRVRLDK